MNRVHTYPALKLWSVERTDFSVVVAWLAGSRNHAGQTLARKRDQVSGEVFGVAGCAYFVAELVAPITSSLSRDARQYHRRRVPSSGTH